MGDHQPIYTLRFADDGLLYTDDPDILADKPDTRPLALLPDQDGDEADDDFAD